MQPYRVVDKQRAPDGVELELVRHGDAWIVRVGGQVLMSSRSHGSEVELARLGFEALAPAIPQRVLVGGLGLGFTLRATLDRAAAQTQVVVSELVPAIVAWNRAELAPLAAHPLQDARTQVALGSVSEQLARPAHPFDLVLLDVDNGPAKVAHAGNDSLYGDAGSRAAWSALAAGGVLAVWSAARDPRYLRTLERAGFSRVEEKAVRAHGRAGARHFVFLAKK